jgi:hypothetical protein
MSGISQNQNQQTEFVKISHVYSPKNDACPPQANQGKYTGKKNGVSGWDPDTASRGTSKPRFQAGIRAREIKRIAFP